MARSDRRVRTPAVSQTQPSTTPVRAGCGRPVQDRLLEELRQVGRELLQESVPQRLLDTLRDGDPQD